MPSSDAEWLVEEGIGETRALLVENGEVLAAKLHWPGELTAGQCYRARLTSKTAGARRGTVTLDNGREVLIDHLPATVSEGAEIDIRITRAPIAEKGRFKHAQGRYIDGQDPRTKSVDPLSGLGRTVRQFPQGLWEDVWQSASSGTIEFAQGQIIAASTPAMTLIDIDGPDNPSRTAGAAIPAVAKAIRWFDIGGSIGIDFPTLPSKADRKAIDRLLDTALADWPHERTAMNGFGFVHLVARLEGPSLLHRFASSRVGMCARMALRRAEMVEGAGALLLTVHPALKAKLKPQWLEELARRTGKELRVEVDPGLALEAPHAQIITG